jgi:hypothetical protein
MRARFAYKQQRGLRAGLRKGEGELHLVMGTAQRELGLHVALA